MARPLVLDTTMMVDTLRRPDRVPQFIRTFRRRRLWLSSVTVAELYAGTRSIRDARVLDRVVDTFARAEHLATPTSDDWRRAGQLMARCVRLYGAIEPRDHLADVLIVLVAARLRGTVVTANVRHFERWVQLATGAGHDVAMIHSDAFA